MGHTKSAVLLVQLYKPHLVCFTQGRDKIGPGEGLSRRQVVHPSIPCPSLPAVSFRPALNSFSKTHTHVFLFVFRRTWAIERKGYTTFQKVKLGLSLI